MRTYHSTHISILKDYRNEHTDDTESINDIIKVVRSVCKEFDILLDECECTNAPQIYKLKFTVANVQSATKLQGKLKAISNTTDLMLGCVGTRCIIRNGFTVEIPKQNRTTVGFNETLDYNAKDYTLPCSIGLDTNNEKVIIDLAKAPHLLVAGSTGSGKSVVVNDIIMSLITYRHYEELKFIMIDPKQVEFSVYEKLPHLATPIITDKSYAISVLNELIEKMDSRYDYLSQNGYRNIDECEHLPFPRCIVFIDELADLINHNKAETELALETLLAKGRACGIHLVVATQSPNRETISKKIQANIPCAIALTTKSIYDSKTILDYGGAEKLMGKGDALLKSPTEIGFRRFQSAMITTKEIKYQVENTYRITDD